MDNAKMTLHCHGKKLYNLYGSSSLIKDEADGEARRSNGAFLLDPATLPVPLTAVAATTGLYT
jgi:hypothetical protein